MRHLYLHKRRLVVLKPKIEGLPDHDYAKPMCLFGLSRLFDSVGNQLECRRLLTCALKLWIEMEGRYDNRVDVAMALVALSDVNRLLGLPEEGKKAVEQALKIYEQLDNTVERARCLKSLASLSLWEKQLDTAEGAASRAIGLVQGEEKGNQPLVCESHRVIGSIYQAKGEIEKALRHYEAALAVASSFNWHSGMFWANYDLGGLFIYGGRLDDAYTNLERVKSHAGNSTCNLALAMELQAVVLNEQRRFEEAKSEALRTADLYEKLGLADGVELCRKFHRHIQEKTNDSVDSG